MGHPPHGEAGYPDALSGWRAWLVGRLDEEPPVAHLRHDDTEHLVVTPEVVVAPALRLVQPAGALIVGNDPQHCLDIAELSQPSVATFNSARPIPRPQTSGSRFA